MRFMKSRSSKKIMKMKTLLRFLILIVAFSFCQAIHAAGEDLIPVGNPGEGNNQSPNAQPASSNVVPVAFSTNYASQYPPYATFMQSPYGGTTPYSSGALMQQYGPLGAPYPQSQYPSNNPATANMTDPLGASEVSPYSRYSPYLEVIGEGSNYTLGIDDILTIIVRNQPDFSGRFIVDPEGNIQYNFVGDIPAAGKTKEQLKQEIMKRLTRFVRYPEVAVMISEYRSKAVYVFGFVNSPGKYAMKGDKITVKEAVVAAGLPRMDGSLKRVYVIRPSEYTKDGKPEEKKVDLKKLLQKGESAENFYLQPGDTIVVHQKFFDKFVNAFSRLVGPVFQSAALYEVGFGNDANGLLRSNKS